MKAQKILAGGSGRKVNDKIYLDRSRNKRLS
jgi:hypothetical protein